MLKTTFGSVSFANARVLRCLHEQEMPVISPREAAALNHFSNARQNLCMEIADECRAGKKLNKDVANS